MPAFLEQKLRAEARKKGLTGEHADAYVYGTMNRAGFMKGSKETAKGRAADRAHSLKEAAMRHIKQPR